MAEGALARSRAEVAVSVTGIAGPDGGTATKPVGLVHFACARRGKPTVAREERFGAIGREEVRLASVRVALDLLEAAVAALRTLLVDRDASVEATTLVFARASIPRRSRN